MEKEKLALVALVIIIIVALSAYIAAEEGVFDNLFQEKETNMDGVIQVGDCADVQYTGKFYVNDTVFDTSYEEVAKDAGIYNENKSYRPLKIFVDTTGSLSKPEGYSNYNATMIQGFLEALVGMEEGETKTVTIPPEKGYGIWNESLAEQLGLPSQEINMSLKYSWTESISNFSMYFSNVNISENEKFDYGEVAFQKSGVLNATITNVTDNNLTYNLEPVNGSTFVMPLFNVNATVITSDDPTNFTIHLDFEEGYTFAIQPYAGYSYNFKVIKVNETHAKFALNMNAPSIEFVDQKLVFEIKVLEVYDTAQEES